MYILLHLVYKSGASSLFRIHGNNGRLMKPNEYIDNVENIKKNFRLNSEGVPICFEFFDYSDGCENFCMVKLNDVAYMSIKSGRESKD